MKKILALLWLICIAMAQPFAWSEPTIPPSYSSTIRGRIHTIAVPAETVMNITLSAPLNSKNAQIGDPVTAIVKDPVYVGPFLAVPASSILSGKITDLNRVAQKNGTNPYIFVDFTTLHRPGDIASIPVNAALIAYKTGLLREDYLWKLPQKKDKLKNHLGSALEGATVGFFANPILGPIIGAGAGILKSVTLDKVAQRGVIKLRSNEEIPVAVQSSFKVPISGSSKFTQSVSFQSL